MQIRFECENCNTKEVIIETDQIKSDDKNALEKAKKIHKCKKKSRN